MPNGHPEFFNGLLGGPLMWIESGAHVYELEPVHALLSLEATVKGVCLGPGSTLDRIIWDEIVEREKATWCDALTLWTRDIEFNLLLFGSAGRPEELKCAYFEPPLPGLCKEHLRYWAQTIPAAVQNTIQNTDLRVGISRAATRVRKKDYLAVKELLPEVVVWNRYTDPQPVGYKRQFTRYHAFALDPFRARLQTIPLPTAFLDKDRTLGHIDACAEAARALYERILSEYSMVTGCGNPMRRNLRNLASILADPELRVALVTGEPGTGKENLCRAIYFGNKLYQKPKTEAEALFLPTTAVEIQAAMRRRPPQTPSKFLQARLVEELSPAPAAAVPPAVPSAPAAAAPALAPAAPFIYIDELNKAEQEFLAAMLRTLEHGETELKTRGEPKYILAASQHIDELAKKPPQDFWTRVSHQLRVVHPLARVSEEDGKEFLSSFFYSKWWASVEAVVRNYRDRARAENLIRNVLGKTSHGKMAPSPLCTYVHEVFVNTVVPLVSRDILSVRGAQSILSQAFACVSWLVRFQNPINKEAELPSIEWDIARLVNTAVQDVMAVLNASRATPAGMEDSKEEIVRRLLRAG